MAEYELNSQLNDLDTYTLNVDLPEQDEYTANLIVDFRPTKTSQLTNDGDGASPFATQSYVDTYGGKIDIIQKNGVVLPITNKTVNIPIPTDTNDLTNGAGYITANALIPYALQTSLTAEINDRQEADADLQEDINTINTTISGYGNIVTHNVSEFQPAGNYALQSALTAEVNDRQEADSEIYDEIDTKQDIISDLSNIRTYANNGQSAYTTQQGYGNIVTHNVSEFATSAQGVLADSALQSGDNITELNNNANYIKLTNISATSPINYNNTTGNISVNNGYQIPTTSQINLINNSLQPSSVVNNVTSTTTNAPLSANMGKELQDQITNLKQRGRYLSIWNSTTGLATTTPTVNPYTYKAGDYFIVGVVGSTNYKPVGSTYDKDVPSRTVETETVIVNDTYYYDGTTWSLLHTSQPTIAFSTLAGSPYDNANLTTALNAKVTTNNAITAGTNTKITYDSKGLVTGGTSLEVTDIPNLNLSKIIDVTATASEINVLDGITATTTELNYSDGVTSNIQTQLDSKQVTMSAGTGIGLTNNTISINQVATEGYNISITGTLTTLNGVISGFSSTDYATVPVQFSPSNDSWEIVYKFTTASTKPSRYRYILGSLQGQNSIVIGQYSTGVLTYWLSSQGGSTWDICSDQRGTIVLSDNTTYTVSVAYDGQSLYTMSISTDDGTSWTQDTTLTSSSDIYGGTIYLGSPYDRSNDTCWQGSIDLNNCRMKIGRQGEIWAGFSTTENIAKATENLYGLVKPDNSTITISDGVISASPAVTIDNTTITKNASDELQAVGLVGLTSTITELNYTDGVTSNIQTQLNSKTSIDDTSTTGTDVTWSASKLNTTIGDIETLLQALR